VLGRHRAARAPGSGPANVIWALQYDLAGYFPGPIAALNQIGLANNHGSTKPAWSQVLRLADTGLYTTAAPKPILHRGVLPLIKAHRSTIDVPPAEAASTWTCDCRATASHRLTRAR
jgi:hypothetical protein